MPNFRRYYVPNAIVFITGVTRDRVRYLEPERDVSLLFDTLRCVRDLHPFRLLAYVILPDHFHWLMRVDDAGGNFSKVMHSVKRNYTLNYKKAHGVTDTLNLWQARFWDHVIRDEHDLGNHFDYIHWNPVKHGYTLTPKDWPHSTFQHWFELGYYEPGWGQVSEPPHIADMNFE